MLVNNGNLPDLTACQLNYLMEVQDPLGPTPREKRFWQLISLDPPRVAPAPTAYHDDAWACANSWDAYAGARYRMRAPLFYLRKNLFGSGLANKGLRLMDEPDTHSEHIASHSDFKFIFGKGFLTWSFYGPGSPVYHTQHMRWHTNKGAYPPAEFADYPEGTLAQVIVPIEHPHLTAHEQLGLRADIMDELRYLSITQCWGQPLDPIRI